MDTQDLRLKVEDARYRASEARAAAEQAAQNSQQRDHEAQSSERERDFHVYRYLRLVLALSHAEILSLCSFAMEGELLLDELEVEASTIDIYRLRGSTFEYTESVNAPKPE